METEVAQEAGELSSDVVWSLAVAGMFACVAVSVSQFVSVLLPSWPNGFVVGYIFAVALESVHAHRLLRGRHVDSSDRFRFRFVEWVMLVLAARLGLSLARGLQGLSADFQAWSTDLSTAFGADYVGLMFLVGMAWAGALGTARAIWNLRALPIERELSPTDPRFYLRSTMPRHGRVDRQAQMDRVVSLFFWGGVVLLIFAGLARVNVGELVTLRHGRSSGLILNALAYFAIGFLLISRMQYRALQANWSLREIPVLDKVGRNWLWLLLLLLIVVGLVAALLPVGYSVGLIGSISLVLHWLFYVIVQLVIFLLTIIFALLGLIGRLLGVGSGGSAMPSVPVVPPSSPEAVAQGGSAAWWQIVRSLLVWGLGLLILGYSLFHFARDRLGLFQNFSWRRLFARLRNLWHNLSVGTRQALDQVARYLARSRAGQRDSSDAASRWPPLALRRMSPRQRVRYIYLSLLRRAREQGLSRPPAATPIEYLDLLRAQLSDVEEQVQALTGSFVEARYSEHPVTRESAGIAGRFWRQVRDALRGLGRDGDAGENGAERD